MTKKFFQVGDKAVYSRQVSDKDIQLFAQLSGDENPIHLDDDYAQKSRFGKRIAHGMLSVSFISAALANKLPGPGSIYLGQNLKFKAPVFPGDTVTVTLTVVKFRDDKGIVVVDTTCTNQAGQELISGEAVMKLLDYEN